MENEDKKQKLIRAKEMQERNKIVFKKAFLEQDNNSIKKTKNAGNFKIDRNKLLNAFKEFKMCLTEEDKLEIENLASSTQYTNAFIPSYPYEKLLLKDIAKLQYFTGIELVDEQIFKIYDSLENSFQWGTGYTQNLEAWLIGLCVDYKKQIKPELVEQIMFKENDFYATRW